MTRPYLVDDVQVGLTDEIGSRFRLDDLLGHERKALFDYLDQVARRRSTVNFEELSVVTPDLSIEAGAHVRIEPGRTLFNPGCCNGLLLELLSWQKPDGTLFRQ